LQLQKAHALLARPHVLTKRLAERDGIDYWSWLVTYVIISPEVAHSFSLFYTCTRCPIDSLSSLSLVVILIVPSSRTTPVYLASRWSSHFAGRLIISRNACISSSLASRYHPLCMYLVTIATGHLITSRYVCTSHMSLAFSSHWSSSSATSS
jgi:hypothetical protein